MFLLYIIIAMDVYIWYLTGMINKGQVLESKLLLFIFCLLWLPVLCWMVLEFIYTRVRFYFEMYQLPKETKHLNRQDKIRLVNEVRILTNPSKQQVERAKRVERSWWMGLVLSTIYTIEHSCITIFKNNNL